MSEPPGGRRHSKPQGPQIIRDPDERARVEVRNGLRQYDRTVELIDYWLQTTDREFKLRPSTILELHRIALEGLSAYAGVFRPSGIEIEGSKHEPPGAFQVPSLIEEMCEYVNANLATKSAFHLSAYIMWRLNWIHPFVDGNGRTSRATSYLVLCVKLGERLPGANTIPEQIVQNRRPYFDALEAADRIAQEGQIDVTDMERLLQGMLAKQLLGVIEKAGG